MNKKAKKSLLFAFMISVLTVLTVFSVSAKTVTKNKLVYEVSKKTATLVECKSNAKKIKIPSKVGKYKVTAIGEWAFSGKNKLQSVEIPESVTKIGKAAFNECISLKKIVIPSKVKRISSSAFWYCTGLEKAVIPESVTKFGKSLFEGCEKLTVYVVKGSEGEKYIKKQGIPYGYRYMTTLKLDADSVMLKEDDTYKLAVTKKPKKLYNSKVTFSSSDKTVAVVNSKGLITANAPGTAVITCKAKDGSGKKAVCTVTVKAKKAKKAVSLAPTAPSAVTGLKVTAVSDNSVSLSWNKSTDATGYKIYLYDAETNVYNYKWATAALSAEIGGLEPGKEYSFSVKAYKRNIYSSTDSVSYSGTVKGKTLPGRVSEIFAADELIYPDKMTLSWNAVEGADGYNLYMYSKTEKDYVLKESTVGLSGEVIGLSPGTDYYFRIKTFSGEDKKEGAFSKTFTFTTDYIPATEQQAVEGFIDALSATKNLDGSFELIKRFSVSVSEFTEGTPQSVIDSLSLSENVLYSFENGFALKDGEKIPVNDVIHPYGEESSLTCWDIEKDSVAFSQNGYGYAVSFEVIPEETGDIAVLTDIEKIKSETPGFVLHSYETGSAKINTKVIEGTIEHLMIKVPVTLTFYFGGEKYDITYEISQTYICLSE